MIKAVLFDFDGVVVQSEPLHMQTFLELLAPFGVSVSRERWYREFAGTGSRHIFEVLVRENNLKLDADGLVAERKRIYEARVRSGALQETPGVREFLGMLRSQGIRTAIVSGSHRTNVQAALETLRLDPFFDIIVSGDDLAERKPEPGPFLHAAERLGVLASECLVIEDSYPGCLSARKAGMRLVWLRPEIELESPRPDATIRDFTGEGLREVMRMLG